MVRKLWTTESIVNIVLLIVCDVLNKNHQIEGSPIAMWDKRVFWSRPCTPFAGPVKHCTTIENHPSSDDLCTILQRLTGKISQTVHLVKYIKRKMVKRIGDKGVIKLLKKSTLQGFPHAGSKKYMNIPSRRTLYRTLYRHLVKVAVFIEQMMEDNSKTRFDIENLLFLNLSQMCELRLAMLRIYIRLPVLPYRNILGILLNRPDSIFKLTVKCFLIMYKYEKMLKIQGKVYSNIKCRTK